MLRAIYQELVEIDLSLDKQDARCWVVRAAESRLKAAGLSSDEVQVLIPDGAKPDDGNIVACIRSKSANGARNPKKGVLLCSLTSMSSTRSEDWERDPFRLVEENGYFYGRGASDDSAMAASLSSI